MVFPGQRRTLARRSLLAAGAVSGIASYVGTQAPTAAATENASADAGRELAIADITRDNWRLFISHRGVHLKQTVACENSLEAVRLARRAGFDCVEFDVWLTADGQYAVMHDRTLNRTVLNADGTELAEPVEVTSQTLEELKTKYILKTSEVRNRSTIPTYQEFLRECKKCGVLPFIEIKQMDMPAEFYIDLIRIADEIMGKNRYVVTSNNNANRIIRGLGIDDVTLMGILYQTTFEEIEGLGNIIMAISATRFPADEYAANVTRTNAAGMRTESHTDNFARFRMADTNGIDIVSTDLLAPDIKNHTAVVVDVAADGTFEGFRHTGTLADGQLTLGERGTVMLRTPPPAIYLGGIYLDLEMTGSCEVALGDQTFSIESPEMTVYRHQVMTHGSRPAFRITATADCVIKNLSIRVARF